MREKGLEPTDSDWELYQQANESEDPVPTVPLAVPVTEAAAAPSAPIDLRSFIDELFKPGEPLSDYTYTWEGDKALKLAHRDNDECLACCAPGCHQDLVWNVTANLPGSCRTRWRARSTAPKAACRTVQASTSRP